MTHSEPRRRRTSAEPIGARPLKPITIWTLDVEDPAFRHRLEQDIARLRGVKDEREEMDDIESDFLEHMRELDAEEDAA